MTAPARLAPVAPRGARALALLPLALVVISTIAANAVPVAVTSVSCSATSSGDDSKVFGPLPVGLFTACDRASIGRQASSDVQTDLGPGLPRAGAVIASANASSSSFLQAASASSGGTVSYYFEVVEEIPPPFAPVTFPIYFEARGEGTLSGGSDPDTFGSATASFTVQAGLPEAGISFGLRNVDSSETSFDSFDDNTVVDLAPNSASNPFYTVELFAGCQADASG
ncbi:MAG: hypothetical protein QNK05_25640, partial [Myxococcota bacterium]|nr:hypothetical protein [Myxococcota bacterium]